jgi:hypothetical protein
METLEKINYCLVAVLSLVIGVCIGLSAGPEVKDHRGPIKGIVVMQPENTREPRFFCESQIAPQKWIKLEPMKAPIKYTDKKNKGYIMGLDGLPPFQGWLLVDISDEPDPTREEESWLVGRTKESN